MLNLRDPKIIRYPTQTDGAYGSPSCTEPPPLTAVMMNDMTPFQTGVEEHQMGEFLRISVVIPKPTSMSLSRFAGYRGCARGVKICVSIRILRMDCRL